MSTLTKQSRIRYNRVCLIMYDIIIACLATRTRDKKKINSSNVVMHFIRLSSLISHGKYLLNALYL